MALQFSEFGASGLRHYRGEIQEEHLRSISGAKGRRKFQEMADNDSTIGAVLFAIEMLLRRVPWRIEPFSNSPVHREQAMFVESLMDDMSHSFEDFIAEALSFITFGFSVHEIVYKRRIGKDETSPERRSNYSDGLIGWRKLPVRAQTTIDRWELDDDGGIQGVWQSDVDAGRPAIFIPIERLLLFRTTSRRNNPEGRSALRNAYVSYYFKTKIAEIEAIGVDRDLGGIPVLYAPPALFDVNAPPDIVAQRNAYQRILANIRADQQASLMLPSIYDERGNQLLRIELMGTGSRRLFDTGAIIERYERAMLSSLLADFIMLGHEKVGSYALSSDKTSLFITALEAWLGEIASVLNRHALTRLYQLNGWDPSEIAQFVPGEVSRRNVKDFAETVARLTGAGWITPGSQPDEDYIRDMLDMPSTETVNEAGSGGNARSGASGRDGSNGG